MRKILLNSFMAAGDVVAISGAVRDLKISHPDLQICVNTNSPENWQNNLHISMERVNPYSIPGLDQFEIGYNNKDGHLVECFRREIERKMNLTITRGPNHGCLFLSEEELNRPREIKEPYWIVMAGGKYDITIKWFPYYQQVIDGLKGKVQFVQCGAGGKDFHPPLKNVINKVGRSSVRDFLLLLYHADGLLSPITFAQHALAALPIHPDRPKKGVVICGGREDLELTYYPHNLHLDTIGQMPCCEKGGCWKTWSHLEEEGEAHCQFRKKIDKTLYAECMTRIAPVEVIDAITSQLSK